MDLILSVQNKNFSGKERSLRKFLEPSEKPKVIYTDNSFEFGKHCEDLSWNHCTSTRHRSETNGTAERAVRRIKERTYAVLLQSSLDENWWADSVECCCNLRKKTPYERRVGEPFKGPIILFRAMVEYHLISTRDLSRLHQLGKKVLPGIFLGCALIAGGFWKGDILIADLEDLKKVGFIRNLSSETQRERSIDNTQKKMNSYSW